MADEDAGPWNYYQKTGKVPVGVTPELPPDLVDKILQKERSRDDSVSPKGAIGKMQVMPATGAPYLKPGEDLKDPAVNDRVGRAHIADLWNKYKDPTAVMVAYNAGSGVADKWLAVGKDASVLPAETQRYIGTKAFLKSGPGYPGISEKALDYQFARSNTRVDYYTPDEYLAMLPPIEGDETSRQKSHALRRSLYGGDEIEAIPELDVKQKGGKVTVYDWDGRHRAEMAKEAGIPWIPVAVHGVSGDPAEITDMHGTSRRYDFQPVEREGPWSVSRETSRDPRFDPYGAAMDVLGRITRPITEAALGGKAVGPRDVMPRQPEAEVPQGRHRGTILPIEGDVSTGDWNFAVPEMIAAPVRGMISMGERAMGKMPAGGPLAPLEGEQLSTLAALAGSPMGGMADRGMMAAAAPSAAAAPLSRLSDMVPPRPVRAPTEAPIAPLAREVFGQERVGSPGGQQAMNRAALKTMGEDASHGTQDVMARGKARIGAGLDRIEKGHDAIFDPTFREDWNELGRDAEGGLATEGQIRVVKKVWRDVMVDPVKTAERKEAAKAAKPTSGTKKAPPKDVLRSRMTGEQFANLMHEKGPISKLQNNGDSAISRFGYQMEEALRDMFQRNLSPEVATEYTALRYQYKNMKTIAPVVEKSPTGDIDPSKLNDAVSRSFEDRAYRASELDQLAKAGVQYMKQAGPERKTLRLLAEMTGGVLGGMALHGLHGYPVGHLTTKLALDRLMRPPRIAPKAPGQSYLRDLGAMGSQAGSAMAMPPGLPAGPGVGVMGAQQNP